CAADAPPGSNVSIAQIADKNHPLTAWATSFTDATQFFIVGHCDDVALLNADNIGLARNRAETLKRVLTEDGDIDAGRIVFRGEQDPAGASERAQVAASLMFDSEGVDPNDPNDPPVKPNDSLRDEWLEKKLYEGVYEHLTDLEAPIRRAYRRADVFAIGGQLKPNAKICPDLQAADATPERLILVPGDDGVEPNKPKPKEPELEANYVARIKVGWDSPSYVNPNDFIPTLAEVQLSVQKR